MSYSQNRWVVCQIGAREHYSIARALHRAQVPVTLLTDFWSGGRVWGIPSRVAQRYHVELADANIFGFNAAYVGFLASAKVARLRHWDWILAQNQWFEHHAAKQLALQCQRDASPNIVFAYSYAAKSIFEAAKRSGCTTLLGQIDPGPVEMRLVKSLHDRVGCEPLREPPLSYWDRWHQECELADGIVVNSSWSRDALVREGVSAEKISVIPLAYEMPPGRDSSPKVEATEFTSDAPLKVLFLGQVNRRKGGVELLGAIESMRGEAVHWTIVGPVDDDLLDEYRRTANTSVVGPVTRSDAARYYRDADVFVLPTHSDGFALTQLEAASYGLPLIVSRFCGDVVTHNRNGIVMQEVTVAAIVNAVRELLTDPAKLIRMARCQSHSQHLTLSELADHLQAAADRASKVGCWSREDRS